MSENVVLPQLYAPLFGAVSINHRRSPFLGPPSEWDVLGSDALLLTQRGERILIGERFRRKKEYEHFNDITIRWRSSMTGEVLEPHTLNCQYFIYAYIDKDKKLLGKWWVLYPTKFLEMIRSDVVKAYEFRNGAEGGSIFRAFKPHDLEIRGCVYKHGIGPLEP